MKASKNKIWLVRDKITVKFSSSRKSSYKIDIRVVNNGLGLDLFIFLFFLFFFFFYFILVLSQTSFSLYLHNQWTDFHKLSCSGKPQMRAIRTYMGCTKSDNKWLRYQTISSCKSFVCKYLMNSWTDSHSWTCVGKCSLIHFQRYMMHLKAISIGRDTSISM